eukprot:UN28473
MFATMLCGVVTGFSLYNRGTEQTGTKRKMNIQTKERINKAKSKVTWNNEPNNIKNDINECECDIQLSQENNTHTEKTIQHRTFYE